MVKRSRGWPRAILKLNLNLCLAESVSCWKKQMSPADVAEHLMPKTTSGDPTFSLESLVQALETEKEEARLKAEEEAKKIEQPG
jgi:hypothetical protein